MWRAVPLLIAMLLPLVANAAPQGIAQATYGLDVDVYPHRIMGDVQEKQQLNVVDVAGNTVTLTLSGNVFEDMEPRVADMNGDGLAEVVVIETNPSLGASLAIYGVDDGALVKLASTPYIGRAFRWLAPAGIADFNGDGQNDVAYVETPHLGKLLRFWTMRDGALVEIAQAGGLTNHRIGEETISGGVRVCDGVTEIVTASADWRFIVATRLVDGEPEFRTVGPFGGPQSFEDALVCR